MLSDNTRAVVSYGSNYPGLHVSEIPIHYRKRLCILLDSD